MNSLVYFDNGVYSLIDERTSVSALKTSIEIMVSGDSSLDPENFIIIPEGLIEESTRETFTEAILYQYPYVEDLRSDCEHIINY